MKRPDFLQSLDSPAQPGPSAPRVRAVSWQPGPSAPVAAPKPRELAPAPPPELPPVALVPPPPPSPPPPPQIIVQPDVEARSAALRSAIEALRAQGERLAEQARSDSLELGVIIARRILEREISADLGAVFSLIKSAIRRAGEAHVTRVRVNPHDGAALEIAARAEFSLGKIELMGDASLERGDVVVETEHHEIDGRLATRMAEIVKLVSEVA